MEISRFKHRVLYQVSLRPASARIRSASIAVNSRSTTWCFRSDRTQGLLVQPNYRYRAISPDAAERRAVEESFARSVLWGFKVEATEGDRVLVDATGFFLRDTHGVIERLRQARQGSYRFDESRSAIYLPRTKVFPKNTEVETLLTVASEAEIGPLVPRCSVSSIHHHP